jgi:hypothetical protein
MRLSQLKFSEAKAFFDVALANDSNNFLVYFYSAFLINREQTDDAGMVEKLAAPAALRMRMLLRRSITLNPSHAESYKLLAFVSLVNGDELDSALSAIGNAVTLQPGNQEYRLISAQLLLRLERASEAAAVAGRIMTSTTDRYLISQADDVLRSANEFLKAEQGEKALRPIISENRRPPVFLKRQDLTDEDVAKIERDRENNNLNRLIDRPGPSERQEVGRIERLTCANDGVRYRFRGSNGVINLAGKAFDDLNVRVLLSGTHSFTFGCGISLADVLAVAIYRPTTSGDGALRSVAFVPAEFRLKSLEELAREPLIIIEGMTPSDLAANVKTSAAEQAELDRQIRETQMRNIELRLRSPARGESRLIATPESLVCSEGRYILTANIGNSQRTFSSPILNRFILNSQSPETGVLEIDCRSPLPPLSAVITYRAEPDGRDELIAVEYVPKAFKLP